MILEERELLERVSSRHKQSIQAGLSGEQLHWIYPPQTRMTDFIESIHTAPSVDGRPVRGATMADLNLVTVAEVIQSAIQRERYTGPTEPTDYLLQRRCLVADDDGLHATLAGLLCFGYEPQRFFPRAVIDIGHYRGDAPLTYEVVHLEKDIGGTVFDQLSRVETYLWTNTHHGMTDGPGLQRIDVHDYPRRVVREIGVNMVAHRDYLQFGSACQVSLYRNRIEWSSPGGLPAQVTIENILRAQYSRNPAIVSVLYDAGYVEAFGQGLDTVVDTLRLAGGDPPMFEDIGVAFIVTVQAREWRKQELESGVTVLSDSQRKILRALQARPELAISEIEDRIESRSRRSLQRDLSDLIEQNLVEAYGEKRWKRYRLPLRRLDGFENGGEK